MPIVEMERIEHFSSAHRLNSNRLSEEENQKIYGKCNNANGHGHNYIWKITLRGELDPVTGMVFDLAVLKKMMAEVMELIDHKNIDKDIEYFKDVPSTSENVCIFLWNELSKRLSEPALLYKSTLHETKKNIFVYRGE